MTKQQNIALQRLGVDISVRDAEVLLESLRWREDMCVIDDFGEKVWLKPLYNKTGNRLGITSCCFADNPCEHHRRIAAKNAIADAKEKGNA